jgi:hypothetical protein
VKTTTAASPERKPRCRMRSRLDDRCQNEVVDDDPGAPQICVRHALEGARLLADAGAIRFQFANTTRRTE